MAVTSKLKKQIDLPVWEWTRPALASVVGGNSTCTDPTSGSRYIYYINNANTSQAGFSRYDTVSDSWQALSNTINNFVNNATTLTYSKWHGHYGRAISAGTGLNTIEMAALVGNNLVGYKIRIIAGKGIGQERTITAVSDPIIKDRGLVSSTSNTAIVGDTSGSGIKQWRVNQWRDYQVRSIYGTTAGSLVRPILYNNYNTLTFSDASWASITPWWGPTSPITTATTSTPTLFQIESNIVTVDSNWTTTPDSTSQFMILSDGIWYLNSSSAGAGYTITYYDIVADIWYNKTSVNNLFTTNMGIDACSEKFLEYPNYILIDNVTSATANTLTDSSLSLGANQFANCAVSILSGTGAGQYRGVIANNSNTFFIGKKWNTTPDNTSQFAIHRDVNNFYWTGNGQASIFQYDVDCDQTVPSKIYDNGVARTVTVTGAGFEPMAVTSITRVTGAATAIAIATAGTNYAVDTIITFSGGASVRVTGINSTGGITSISIENFGSGYAGGGAAMTISGTVPTLPTGSTAATFTNTTASVAGNVVTVAPHPFKIGDSVTIAGDTAASPNFNNTYTIISNNAVTGFGFITSAAQNATVPAQGTTSLVDVTKNWTTNELANKIVQFTSGASPSPTVQARKIISNTANTITFATATAATNSTSRYVIIDEKAFATEQSYAVAAAGGKAGVATSGTSSSLTDTTKNWPINYWTDIRPAAGGNTARKVKIIAGTGNGAELVITSNTANTLNFASQSFTVDNTTVYEIMESFGTATSGSITTLVDTTQNWPTNSFLGKRVRLVSGAGISIEVNITANTQTQLTFNAIGTAVDSTTSYSIIEPTTRGAGSSMFILRNSTNSNINNRFLYMFRGGGTVELGRYNTRSEIYEPITTYPMSETLTTGTSYAYDGVDRIYFQKDVTGRCYYYDVVENMIIPSSTCPYSQGTGSIGNRMEIITTEDSLKYLYTIRNGGQEMWRTLLFW
ncbi:MAG: hypothetical protein EBU90_00490 [Proteobacteria bacterium]|nr:hypothetical protein [Pseudomonadota bacterium]NBP12909.1 hypothetical protein [bacterium]